MTDPTPLSSDEQNLLRRVVGMIIPESAEHGVPGADDPVIFAEIIVAAGEKVTETRKALQAVGAVTAEMGDLTADALGEALNARHSDAAEHLQTLTTQCYYRDPRVLTALGIEPRPPFPKGYQVEQGDFSLLDPVRARGEIWRRVE